MHHKWDDKLFRRKIKQMKSGEWGWTVPWALKDGTLREDYPIFESQGGNATLEVRCVKHHKYKTYLQADPFYTSQHSLKQTTNRIVVVPETCPGCSGNKYIKLSRTQMQCVYCGRVTYL